MLTTFEIATHSIAALLLPLAIVSMVTGALPHPSMWLGRLYRAEPLLSPLGNAFLVLLSLHASTRIATHFGHLDRSWLSTLDHPGLVFLVLSLAILGLMARGAWRLSRLP